MSECEWCNWDFLLSKIEPHTGWAFVPTGLYFLLPVMRINLQVLNGSGGMIVLWLNRVFLETQESNPWSSIFDQRKSQLHHFTIGFRKPGIRAIENFSDQSVWRALIKKRIIKIKENEHPSLPHSASVLIYFCL